MCVSIHARGLSIIVNQVLAVQWSPFVHTQFLTASKDKSVAVWDFTEGADAGRAMLFYHMGHNSFVQDANWNENRNYLNGGST